MKIFLLMNKSEIASIVFRSKIELIPEINSWQMVCHRRPSLIDTHKTKEIKRWANKLKKDKWIFQNLSITFNRYQPLSPPVILFWGCFLIITFLSLACHLPNPPLNHIPLNIYMCVCVSASVCVCVWCMQ